MEINSSLQVQSNNDLGLTGNNNIIFKTCECFFSQIKLAFFSSKATL